MTSLWSFIPKKRQSCILSRSRRLKSKAGMFWWLIRVPKLQDWIRKIRRLYRSQVAKAQAKKIKKVQSGKKIGKKAVKDSATKTAQYTAKKVAKETAKETVKETAKIVAKETAKATAKVVTTTATTTAGIR